MAARMSGNTLVIEWPAWGFNYQLESATTLFPPDWHPAGEIPDIVNDMKTVTPNISTGDRRYYRLRNVSP